MKPEEYRKQYEEVFAQVNQLADKLETHEYTSKEELDRDVSILAECHQKFIDISTEIINDEDKYGR